ncbi:WD40/YVTN/BNR-like repeat-containing protein [Emticicia sp. SJ17W-69]|uniref:WD40/YVTN/BNR-like repeat-containing protein n=1 Tax=Emticicia sp. SJ17W-69 TaxID=3421657 RepID=UPI003EBC2577
MKKLLFFLLFPFIINAQITLSGSSYTSSGYISCGTVNRTYALANIYNGKNSYVFSSGDGTVIYCSYIIRWNSTSNIWELVYRSLSSPPNNYTEQIFDTVSGATTDPPCGAAFGGTIAGASCSQNCINSMTVSGTTNICYGQSTTLTATGCAGVVTWSNGTTGGSTTTANSGTITANCSTSGVCSVSKTITVNDAAPTPTLNSGSKTLCQGSSFLLTASGCSGSLLWSNGATTSALTIASNGSYSASCTVNGCTSTSTYANFTFVPMVTISGSNCLGTTLTASGQGVFPIQWLKSEEVIAGATANTYTPITTGTYQVKVVGNDGKWTVTGAPNLANALDMFFIDDNNGWLLNQYSFLKTTDGGKNWNTLSSNNNSLKAFHFLNATTGFAVGNAGVIKKTIDGGITWTSITSPTTANLRFIQFVDANNGFIMDNFKETLKTTDGGTTWTIVSAADPNTSIGGINDMVFVTNTIGFATGKTNGSYLGIWKTVNAGTTWTALSLVAGQSMPTEPSYPKISMFDANNGWLFRGSYIYKTTDGGATWVNKPFFESLYNARFINVNKGWILTGDNFTSEKKLYSTNDGGNTWTKEEIEIAPNTTDFNGDFFAFNANTAFYSGTITYSFSGSTYPAIGRYEKQMCLSATKTIISVQAPSVSVSGNGGATICTGSSITLNANGCNSPAIWIAPATTANAITVSPTTTTTYQAKCVDSGCESSMASITVTVHNTPTISGVTCVGSTLTASGFGSASIQWLKDGVELTGATAATYIPTQAGVYQVATTSLNGAWTSLTSPTNQSINGVYFVNSEQGWIVGGAGIIYKTVNAGTSWTQQTSGITSSLTSVFFTDNNNGIAVGNNGKILRTTNSGTSWTEITSNTTNTLYDVFFINSTTGWAVGGQYIVLKTTDGGASWTTISIDNTASTSDYYSKVQFIDANTGYVSGGKSDFSESFVRKSVNGGTTWTSSYSSGSASGAFMFGLSFINANTGWVGGSIQGSAPYAHKTTNAGSTWNSLSFAGLNIYNSIRSIQFVDANRGWMLASNSSMGYNMLSTTDGGATFTRDITTNASQITSQAIGRKLFMLPDGKSGWMVGYIGWGQGYLMKFSTYKICSSNTLTIGATPDAPTLNLTGTQTLCPSASINLIASACSGTVNWSNGSTGSTLTVSLAGTYSATCTNLCGTSTPSTQVIVTSVPASQTLSGIATDGVKQAGQTITSTQTINSGINTSYKAGKSVLLNPTFQTQVGVIFKAEIGGCN